MDVTKLLNMALPVVLDRADGTTWRQSRDIWDQELVLTELPIACQVCDLRASV